MTPRHRHFLRTDGSPRRLLGCAVNTGSPRVAELAGHLGFDAVWIDLEHSSTDVLQAEHLCTASECAGALPLIRTAGIAKDHILPALDLGAKIIVAPMIQTAAEAAEFVRQARARPHGVRGYNTRSRALRFGLDAANWEALAGDVCLFAQIESAESVRNLEGILDTPSLDGILVGPGDLSADLGVPGNFVHPPLKEMVQQALRQARRKGRLSGIYAGEGPLLEAALQEGVDLVIVANDFKALIDGWEPLAKKYRDSK